jgi:sugar lactone lactonase YvrE
LGNPTKAPDGGSFDILIYQKAPLPNGMAITPDKQTLIMAESHGKMLTALDIVAHGSLSNLRVWADLGSGVPDDICIDADGAVWYADVPNDRCVRVREGREVLQTINLDRGCFACMLGARARKHCS